MKVVLFRTDGGAVAEVGTGHIHRSLLVAGHLRDSYKVIFTSLDSPAYEYGHSMIRNSGYSLHLLSPDDCNNDLARLVEDSKPDLIICDRYRYNEEELRILKRYDVPLLTYDHFEEHRRFSDYQINAIVEEVDNPYSGPRYIVIPPVPMKAFRTTPEKIFICFGGFDYLDITLKLVNILSHADIGLPIDVVIGNGYPNTAVLYQHEYLSGGKIRIHRQPFNFQELMAGADIAFVAGGLVFYQVLSLGIAAVVICQYNHQLEQVRNLDEHRICTLLGMGNTLDHQVVISLLQTLMNDVGIRHDIYERGRTLVDGKGLSRVVNIIRERLTR